jgi:hypothetical protein
VRFRGIQHQFLSPMTFVQLNGSDQSVLFLMLEQLHQSAKRLPLAPRQPRASRRAVVAMPASDALH